MSNNGRYSDLRAQLKASGMVRIPDSELPEHWDRMDQKQRDRWMSGYVARKKAE